MPRRAVPVPTPVPTVAAVRFLLDNTVPNDAADAFAAAGHKIERHDGGEPLFAAARDRQLEPVTADRRVADRAGKDELGERRVVVFLHAADAAAVGRLFTRFKRLSPGRLYTATAAGAKVRQLPAHTASTPSKAT